MLMAPTALNDGPPWRRASPWRRAVAAGALSTLVMARTRASGPVRPRPARRAPADSELLPVSAPIQADDPAAVGRRTGRAASPGDRGASGPSARIRVPASNGARPAGRLGRTPAP